MISSMWTYLSYGAILGLSAGVSPGPLLALVISQTLQHNAREGARVAAAPVLTDLPIILLGLLVLSSLPEPRFVLGVLSFAGSVFVMYLGVSSLRYQSPDLELPTAPPRSYFKGALVNLLSPHPYLFWFTVGVPTILKAYPDTPLGALGFVVIFFSMIVGSKVAIAVIVGRSKRFLVSSAYRWIMRILGVLMMGFSLVLFHDGLVLTGII